MACCTAVGCGVFPSSELALDKEAPIPDYFLLSNWCCQDVHITFAQGTW